MTQTPTDALRLVPNMPTVELTDDMLFKIETGETVTWGELKRRQYEQAVRNFNTMREDGSLPAPASPLPEGGGLPADVVRLVVAARMVAFDRVSPATIAELDAASEAFASRVPWDNAPDEIPAAPTGDA